MMYLQQKRDPKSSETNKNTRKLTGLCTAHTIKWITELFAPEISTYTYLIIAKKTFSFYLNIR